MEGPEIIVSTADNPEKRAVKFEELFALRPSIVEAVLLWDTNSYYVNVRERYFIVNGGRKMHISLFPSPEFFYLRRNRKQVELGGEGEHETEVSYMIGMKQGESSISLHTSPDGKFWRWSKDRD